MNRIRIHVVPSSRGRVTQRSCSRSSLDPTQLSNAHSVRQSQRCISCVERDAMLKPVAANDTTLCFSYLPRQQPGVFQDGLKEIPCDRCRRAAAHREPTTGVQRYCVGDSRGSRRGGRHTQFFSGRRHNNHRSYVIMSTFRPDFLSCQ